MKVNSNVCRSEIRLIINAGYVPQMETFDTLKVARNQKGNTLDEPILTSLYWQETNPKSGNRMKEKFRLKIDPLPGAIEKWTIEDVGFARS
jgi:hypothetical protein